jgi:hypothetical protein
MERRENIKGSARNLGDQEMCLWNILQSILQSMHVRKISVARGRTGTNNIQFLKQCLFSKY